MEESPPPGGPPPGGPQVRPTRTQQRRAQREERMTAAARRGEERARTIKRLWWSGLVQDMATHLHVCEKEVLRRAHLGEGDARPQAAYAADLRRFESAMSPLGVHTADHQLVHPLVQIYRDRISLLNAFLPPDVDPFIPRWRADISEVITEEANRHRDGDAAVQIEQVIQGLRGDPSNFNQGVQYARPSAKTVEQGDPDRLKRRPFLPYGITASLDQIDAFALAESEGVFSRANFNKRTWKHNNRIVDPSGNVFQHVRRNRTQAEGGGRRPGRAGAVNRLPSSVRAEPSEGGSERRDEGTDDTGIRERMLRWASHAPDHQRPSAIPPRHQPSGSDHEEGALSAWDEIPSENDGDNVRERRGSGSREHNPTEPLPEGQRTRRDQLPTGVDSQRVKSSADAPFQLPEGNQSSSDRGSVVGARAGADPVRRPTWDIYQLVRPEGSQSSGQSRGRAVAAGDRQMSGSGTNSRRAGRGPGRVFHSGASSREPSARGDERSPRPAAPAHDDGGSDARRLSSRIKAERAPPGFSGVIAPPPPRQRPDSRRARGAASRPRASPPREDPVAVILDGDRGHSSRSRSRGIGARSLPSDGGGSDGGPGSAAAGAAAPGSPSGSDSSSPGGEPRRRGPGALLRGGSRGLGPGRNPHLVMRPDANAPSRADEPITDFSSLDFLNDERSLREWLTMANTVMSEEDRRTVANLEGLDVEQLIRIIANARGANVREVKPSVFFDAKPKYCSSPVWDVPASRPSDDYQGGDVDCFIDEKEYICLWLTDLNRLRFPAGSGKARHHGRVRASAVGDNDDIVLGTDAGDMTAQWSSMSERDRREYGDVPPATAEAEAKAGGSFLPIRLWRRGIMSTFIVMLAAGDWITIGGVPFPVAPITLNSDRALGFGAVYGYMCMWLLWRTWSNRSDEVAISMLTTDITGAGNSRSSDTQKGKVAGRHGRTVMTGVCFRRHRRMSPLELPVSSGFMVCTYPKLYSAMLYPYVNAYEGRVATYWTAHYEQACKDWSNRYNSLQGVNSGLPKHRALLKDVLTEDGIHPSMGSSKRHVKDGNNLVLPPGTVCCPDAARKALLEYIFTENNLHTQCLNRYGQVRQLMRGIAQRSVGGLHSGLKGLTEFTTMLLGSIRQLYPPRTRSGCIIPHSYECSAAEDWDGNALAGRCFWWNDFVPTYSVEGVRDQSYALAPQPRLRR